MKNSGWHHKLWSKKLDELHINEDIDASWAEMQSILDKTLPFHHHGAGNGGGTIKTIGSKIVSLLGYILPAAAMISVVTYIALKEPRPEKPSTRVNKKELQKDSTRHADAALNSKTNLKVESLEDTVPSKKETHTDQTEAAVSEPLSVVSAEVPGPGRENLSSSNYKQLLIPVLTDTLLYGKLLALQQQQPGVINYMLPAKTGRQKKHSPVKIKDRKLKTWKAKKKSGLTFASGLVAGAGTGINIYNSGTTFFLEGALGFSINQKITVNTGLRANTARTMKGVYNFQNYKPADSSMQQLSVVDSRKLTIIDIPLNLEYKISNKMSLRAGPVISFNLKENGIRSKLDTSIYHPIVIHDIQKINTAIDHTRATKVAIGLSTGLSLRIKQFSINADYLKNIRPYKITNDLGTYKNTYNSFQLGIRYNFK